MLIDNTHHQSIYFFLTNCGSKHRSHVPQLSTEDATFVYKLAAFDVAWDPKLRKSAQNGSLFTQLCRLFMEEKNGPHASKVLNAIQNAFFLRDQVWVRLPNGDVALNEFVAREISEIASLDEANRGVRPGNLIIRSAIAHTRKQHKNCAQFISGMIALELFDEQIPKCHYGAYSYRPPTKEIFDAISKQHLPEDGIDFLTKPAVSSLAVIVCAVDPQYFKVYASNFLSSLRAFGSYGIHFHIVNPDDECFSLFSTLSRKFVDQSVSLSVEVSNNFSKGYYASARFLRVIEILNFVKSDICILDVDVSFSVAPESLFENYRDVQCAFLKRSGYPAYLPWRSVGAGAVFFKWSDRGSRSAEVVAKCIHYLFSEYCGDPERCWWIDQNALFLGTELLRINDMSFGTIPPSFINQLNHTYAAKQRLLSAYQDSKAP